MTVRNAAFLYASDFGDDVGRVALDANDDAATFDREIVLTGDYKNRKFKIARADLDKMIENQRLAQVDPAVDREHESWFSSDATPAFGWVKSLRVEPSKMRPGREALVGTFELNDLGRDAIKNKHFRYLSAGIDFNAKDRLSNADIGAFLDHVAMCKHPYVQGMEPLTLSAAVDSAIKGPNPADRKFDRTEFSDEDWAVVEKVYNAWSEWVKDPSNRGHGSNGWREYFAWYALENPDEAAQHPKAFDTAHPRFTKDAHLSAATSLRRGDTGDGQAVQMLAHIEQHPSATPSDALAAFGRSEGLKKLSAAEQAIDAAIDEYLSQHPNASPSTAMIALQHQRPELFGGVA